MTETKIDVSELKKEGGDLVKGLAGLIEEKTKAEVQTAANDIVVKGEGETTSRKHLRVLLRKFLHKEELRDHFRITGGKENSLVVKEIKIRSEE